MGRRTAKGPPAVTAFERLVEVAVVGRQGSPLLLGMALRLGVDQSFRSLHCFSLKLGCEGQSRVMVGRSAGHFAPLAFMIVVGDRVPLRLHDDLVSVVAEWARPLAQ